VACEGARKFGIGTPVQTGNCGETGNGEGAEPSSIGLRGTCPDSNRTVTVTRSANTAYVMLANFSEEMLTVPKNIVLGVAQQVSEQLIDKINAESESDSDRPLTRKKERKYV